MIIPKTQVTQKLLQEYLNYDPITGYLTWKKKLTNKTVIGKRAGTQVKGRDNRIIKIFGNVFIEHRLIWLYVYGYMPKRNEHIDHIDHNESNNAIKNLRLVSQAENNKNLSFKSNNTTGVMGVWIDKTIKSYTAYVAEIKDNNGKRLRKWFKTLNEAKDQRKLWESQFGFHKNHGSIKP